MFPRIIDHKRKDKNYKYLVISKSIRKNGKSTTKDIANLGNIENFTDKDIENIIDGLIKIFKLEKYALSDEVEIFETLEYGNIILWQKLWNRFDLSKSIRTLIACKSSYVEIEAEKYIEMMVVNRCIKPESKLGIVRWLETTCYKEMKDYSDLMPDVNYFYRSMDYLLAIKEDLESEIFDKLRNLFSINVKMTFYDITSTFVYGDGNCDIAEYGYSRDKRRDCEQVIIGVVTSYEGYPIKHYVFQGDTADNTTVQEVVKDLQSKFHIQDTIFVGDRGMITKLNLKDIENKGFSYIMGVKFRQDAICQMLLEQNQFSWDSAEVYDENLKILEKRVAIKDFISWKIREILTANEIEFSDSSIQLLQDKINALKDTDVIKYKGFKPLIFSISSKIDVKISKKIFALIKKYQKEYEKEHRFIFCLNSENKTIQETRRMDYISKFYKELDQINDKNDMDKSIRKIFEGYYAKYKKFFDFQKDDATEKIVGYSLNQERIEYEKRFDGLFVLLTDQEQSQLPTQKVVESYKNLKEVESFHDDLKNFVDVRPIRHWLEKRVRAHVFICVLALLLKRTFELDCLKNKSVTEPLFEIEKVKLVKYKIKFCQRDDRQKFISKVTTVNPTQMKYFKKAGIKTPMKLDNFRWCETTKP